MSNSPPFRSKRAALGAIYTLTPTHCGTGQTSGAVDLPVARESHTGLPILPSTSLKGAARDRMFQTPDDPSIDKNLKLLEEIFGSDTTDRETHPGNLLFTEARLVALPVRSLNRPFVYATCPLLLDRLDRDLRAWEIAGLFPDNWTRPRPQEDGAQVADESLFRRTLVAEDLIYRAENVGRLPQLADLGEALGSLLPDAEKATRERLARDLVVLPDQDLCDLTRRTLPVQARIQLPRGRTTGEYRNDDDRSGSGNLWYEETLPPDCLFINFVVLRDASRGRKSLDEFLRHASRLEYLQLGGNESVGQGWCWWRFPAGDSDVRSSVSGRK